MFVNINVFLETAMESCMTADQARKVLLDTFDQVSMSDRDYLVGVALNLRRTQALNEPQRRTRENSGPPRTQGRANLQLVHPR